MKFTIARASNGLEQLESPHPLATKGEFYESHHENRIDFTPFTNVEQIWYIEIDSLANLVQLVADTGRVVLHPTTSVLWGSDPEIELPYPHIMIYDDDIE